MPNQYTKNQPLRFKDGLQWCNKHQLYLPLDQFYHYKNGKFSFWCKECTKQNSRRIHKLREADVEYKRSKRNVWIKNTHGISLQEYEEKLAQQNYSCAICQVKLPTSGSKTHLDHDHKTGLLRQFLCTNCNRGLGHFQDSSILLEKAANYLRTHSSDETTTERSSINDCSH